jgi:predicted alpha/beta hydrolase family esterase
LRYLLIPGIGGSGPEHWQTHWERALGAACLRFAPRSWDAPEEDDWLAAITRGVDLLARRDVDDGTLAGVDVLAAAAPATPPPVDHDAPARAAADGRIVLVAHSLGCLAAASWLTRGPRDDRVAGAFLVAPPDREAPSVPAPAAAFACPAEPLGVPALVAASRDDPCLAFPRAVRIARAWAAPLVDLGAVGHVNDESGLGDWPVGRGLLTAFVAGLGG